MRELEKNPASKPQGKPTEGRSERQEVTKLPPVQQDLKTLQRPALVKAEAGKIYQGAVVSADDKQVIQSVKQGGREHHVAHDREHLAKLGPLLRPGAKVEINYKRVEGLASPVVIAKEWKERTAPKGPADGRSIGYKD